MASYVIAKKGSDLLDTPVFYAGESGNEEALAVFTDLDSAKGYLSAAGWTGDHDVGELTALQLLRWLVKAHDQGIRYLAINPDRSQQTAGDRQHVVAIEEKLTAVAESLSHEVFT